MMERKACDPKRTADASARTLAIDGALTIERSGEFCQTLRDALAGAQQVVLDVTQVQEIDIPGLQLICSACKTAAAAGKVFTFAGHLPACLLELKDGIGACQNSPCSHNGNSSCIWFGGMK
ncbi:STAS domain-containing protein [Oryzomonas sagensis]|uniref:STAS domain-containing protein n=1 Tax=Oryzomonas sagensis TaxID=2603857 RepID=A0ABQ6TLW0_9BACT|nr:STAS domain-containing protein [Oryzomonas sagensis]KAB0669405.1 STAS domain-containing protein [Oryzomonas sagensis]